MKVFRSRLSIPALAMTAVFCCAAPASAHIKPFRSIAGFELGIDESAVRAQLGEPSSVRIGPVVGFRHLIYKSRKLEFGILEENGRVGAITTRSRAHRTSNDLGVGTPMKTLQDKLRGEQCNVLRTYTVCSVFRSKKTMDYVVVRGRVQYVTLS